MLFLEVGTDAVDRTGSPLTLATVARDDSIRIGGYFHTQRTARALVMVPSVIRLGETTGGQVLERPYPSRAHVQGSLECR